MTTVRYATVKNADDQKHVEAYLPHGYEVVAETTDERDGKTVFVIAGEDFAGWTLDGYVIPRLGSGLIWATEIAADDPLVAEVEFPSEERLIHQAQRDYAGYGIETLVDALDMIWGNGFADGEAGEADRYGHCFRVSRWLLWTDSQGFKSVEAYRTDTEAEARLNEYAESEASERVE